MPRWPWLAGWVICLLLGAALYAMYALLPTDGMSGDLGSFGPRGFRLQWALEERGDGLRVDDVILRAGGRTVDEWLQGAPRGPEWRSGGTVLYQVLRDGAEHTVAVRLVPLSLLSVARRWAAQLIAAAAYLFIGTFVFLRRKHDRAARILMAFCVLTFLQYLGDGINFPFPTVPWRWPFWIHFCYELLTYNLSLSAVGHFAFLFPRTNPLLRRFPRLSVHALYLVPLLAIGAGMAVTPGASHAIAVGNQVSLVMAVLQVGCAIAAGAHSVRTARDPVSRAQVRWILWSAAVGTAVIFPGYLIPLILGGRPFIPHPVMMIFIALAPVTLAVGILRFRLFAIDIIINRTLVYGTLTALLMGLYFILVRVLSVLAQQVLGRPDNAAVVFGATLASALAFAPLRRRVQLLIDRTFYRTRLDFQRLLPEMSERLAGSIVAAELAATLTVELPRTLQISWARCAVLDAAGSGFVPAAGGGWQFDVRHPLVEHLRGGHSLLRLQPPQRLPPEVQAFMDEQAIEIAVPLIAGAQLVGLYTLGSKLSANGYTGEEVRLLSTLGRQAAIAVQNSRLYHAERDQREMAEALVMAATVIGSTLDLEQVLSRILAQVERVVKGDAYSIILHGDTSSRIVRGRGTEALSVPAALSLERSLAETTRTRWPLVMSDPGARDGEAGGAPGVRSFVAAPIMVGETTFGVLRVDGTRLNQFGPHDAARLDAFTNHAAAAVANARMYATAQAEIAERRRTEDRIVASLKEKEVLLKEVHHRVKNNLQVISSMLYLQSRTATDPAVLQAFQNSRARVRSMALVHELLYRSPDLARVDFAQYAQSLSRQLAATLGDGARPVSIEVAVDGIALGVDTAVPCGLILNELVSNALLHAFTDRAPGTIRIDMRAASPTLLALTVEDDGRGLPAELDVQNTESLGLQIVTILVSQLNGTLSLRRGGGTRFSVTFPREADV